MSVLIKGGTVVTSSDEYRADILIDEEKVTAIGTGLDSMAENIIRLGQGKFIERSPYGLAYEGFPTG